METTQLDVDVHKHLKRETIQLS